MALYSVWDWDRNSYRLYETRRPASVGDDPVPPRPSAPSLGADPDTHVKPLPAGAKFMGYTHVPRGEIRRERRGLADIGDDAGADGSSGGIGSWGKFALGMVVGVVGVLWWRDQ